MSIPTKSPQIHPSCLNIAPKQTEDIKLPKKWAWFHTAQVPSRNRNRNRPSESTPIPFHSTSWLIDFPTMTHHYPQESS
jgi:hypothetical protein